MTLKSRCALALSGLAVLLLCSCASGPTMSKNYMAALEEHGVSGPTFVKIQKGRSLMLSDIEYLVTKKVPSSQIINYLKATRKTYILTRAQYASLRRVGADGQLIQYLKDTKNMYAVYNYGPNPYWDDPYYMGPPPFAWENPYWTPWY